MGNLGDIIAAHGNDYVSRFGARMSLDQLKAMHAIEVCHTPAAGAAQWSCPDCGASHVTYVGCSNRHCPQCGESRAEQWLQKHCALLLPGVTYHLVTFTVPAQLRRVIRSHPKELLDALMRTSASSLMDAAANEQFLGATPGATAVLHTWTRQLGHHPHVHFIVTGGGLDPRGRWREGHPKFLLPVPALSTLLRARFRDAMNQALPDVFRSVPSSVWTSPWVVHSEPVGSGEKALKYLSRYVHQVALSDNAIVAHDDSAIVVRYRKSGTNKLKTMRLAPFEFLRRFLKHVLPKGFTKVRYFGLHHSSKRPVLRLLQAAMCLVSGTPMPAQPPRQQSAPAPECPHCQTAMRFERRLTPDQYALTHSNNRGPP